MINPDSVRVRHCSNDKCLWLFFDDSKWQPPLVLDASLRQRAKAHRHYLRIKGCVEIPPQLKSCHSESLGIPSFCGQAFACFSPAVL